MVGTSGKDVDGEVTQALTERMAKRGQKLRKTPLEVNK